MGDVAIEVGQVECTEIGHGLADGRVGIVAEIDQPELHALEALLGGAELGGREHVDDHAAIGLLLHQFGKAVGELAANALIGVGMAVLHGHLGIRAAHQGEAQSGSDGQAFE